MLANHKQWNNLVLGKEKEDIPEVQAIYRPNKLDEPLLQIYFGLAQILQLSRHLKLLILSLCQDLIQFLL